MLLLSFIDLVVLAVFFATWLGYARFAKVMALQKDTLSSVMRIHREDWMWRLLSHENRIADVSLLGNLERVVSFFASTTLLIIAGVLTAISATEGTMTVIASLPWSTPISPAGLQFKLLVLALVFVYAFFKFTWSIRQYTFCSVLVGSAPVTGREELSEQALRLFSSRAAKLIDLAGHDFNFGLRAYYFALALMVWLLNPWAFVLATLWVVLVLYRREFHSRALKALRESLEYKTMVSGGGHGEPGQGRGGEKGPVE